MCRNPIGLGADPRHQNQSGNSCLVIAAELNNVAIIGLLLDRLEVAWTDRNILEDQKTKALCLAALHKHPEVAQILIDRGTDPRRTQWNEKWYGGARTVCHFAALGSDPESLEIVLSGWSGAMVGNQPLVKVGGTKPQSALKVAIALNRVEVVKVLLKYGAMPTSEEERVLQPPLHFAAKHGRAELVPVLVAAQEDILNRTLLDGRTALWVAAKGDKERCVQSCYGLVLTRLMKTGMGRPL